MLQRITKYEPIDVPQGQSVPKPARGKTPVDHTGRKFGRLTVISYLGRRTTPSQPKCGSSVWLCECECGERVPVRINKLIEGKTVSCQCFTRQILAAAPGRNKKEFGESARAEYLLAYKKSAKIRGHEFLLSAEEFRSLTSSACFYCGWPPISKIGRPKQASGHYYCNGIDRIDNWRGYTTANCRSCCKQCNIAKGVLTESDFFAWARRLGNKTKLRDAKQKSKRGNDRQLPGFLTEDTANA
jgi:hypothetical protein